MEGTVFMRRNLKRKYFGAACVVIEEVNNTRCKYLRDRFLRRGWECTSIYNFLNFEIDLIFFLSNPWNYSWSTIQNVKIESIRTKIYIYSHVNLRELKEKKINQK